MQTTPRKSITPLQRWVLAWRQSYRCAHCDHQLPPLPEADHIIPLHRGGSNCWQTNIQLLCPGCHSLKTCEELLARIERDQNQSSYFNKPSKNDALHPDLAATCERIRQRLCWVEDGPT